MDTPQIKVALYARVSTNISRSVDGVTIFEQSNENQLFKLRQYADTRGYEVVRTYEDRACGANKNRPALDVMRKDAADQAFDIILIVRFDRIARSLVNLLNLMEELDRFNVKLICVDQPEIDTTSHHGRLIMAVLGAIAQYERELTKDRINDSFARIKVTGKTKTGKPVGKPPKFSHEQYAKAKLIKRTNPGVSLHELERQTGMRRNTLRRKLKGDGLL